MQTDGSDENLVANGDFSEATMKGWSKPSWHKHSLGIAEYAASPSSGLEIVTGGGEVVAREYYSVSGVRLANPEGLCIERVRYSDGTVSVGKKTFR